MAIDDHAPGGAGEGVANMVSELNVAHRGATPSAICISSCYKCALSYGGSNDS